ncbi:ATP-grasp domain-containing protein [Sphingomonas ginsenosidivorax]|uniref:ATP-grasp domain-containing protein n=1 Tax=Sphingomonas ginsenosidivorax TaxID=862135 RepID=A0A5C6UC53_9SPHN|nr:biotin carboxylase N-terminal domain-containing protein [Sphingomonas ginsenosidivorax]TXC70224.1 ATP-grasp domain-containing protein [Sphingomonas ginsenosidivorax]
MIESLLIVNRGEIACRIIRTARAMGIRTIAVYSDADATALHVRDADQAVHIGPGPARQSYLVGEAIIAAARDTGAQAIHPGYGFLSENADFAQSVLDAGLVWVGPRPDSIRAMGLKDAAKARMIAAGVPVTPGYLGADQSPERLASAAADIGYPVLIKAVAGGGGKGMRRVDTPAEFADALASCQREAASSFGNTAVLLEKYILSPRHIEVQVFGDTQGTIVHLFERDCSLQRRHQKVIEEAPAPGMDDASRAAICAAAVKAAKAVDYVGAGTIEFIADASDGLRADRIWFMEMNTRLQVEHPVTEAITGIDLVEWQLRVASGEPLPMRQDELRITGWAIEARLYAENPATGFLPSIGRLDHFALPTELRIETGVAAGGEVSAFYDPMIAKLIVHRADRADAIDRLKQACERVECAPVHTNAWFLARLLAAPGYAAGTATTAFIADHLDTLADDPEPSPALLQAAGDALVARHSSGGGASRMPAGLRGFRLNADRVNRIELVADGKPYTVALSQPGAGLYASRDRPGVSIDEDGHVTAFELGQSFSIRVPRVEGAASGPATDGVILAPMPGRIIAVDVVAGAIVTKGQKIVTLEAMKMEHSLTAPFDGVVADLAAAVGGQVAEGTRLARIERSEPPAA